MADISREEVKKIMNSCLGCLMGKYDCVGKPCSMCEHNVSDEEIENAIGKAISDMEKLEKIEQIIKKYNLQNIARVDVDNVVSGFEYEIIMAALGKDIEV